MLHQKDKPHIRAAASPEELVMGNELHDSTPGDPPQRRLAKGGWAPGERVCCQKS